MNEYYKAEYSAFFGAHSEFQKVNLSKISGAEMESIISQFLSSMFGEGLMGKLSAEEKRQMTFSMMAFVYAHRHNKDDLFLMESKDFIDFTVLRDCMYHYSKKAQDRFFARPMETYFFAKFAKSREAMDFIKKKSNMSPENIRKLLTYTSELQKSSIVSLEGQEGDGGLI